MPRSLKPGGLAHARAALARLLHLVGSAQGIAHDDRNPNRQAQLQSTLDEAWKVAFAGYSGEPLPPPVDHRKAV